jgi:hypothetical protein
MKKARTLKDIEQHPLVESTHTEWDGCFTDSWGREVQGRWVYLRRGYITDQMECGTIHERSIKDCCELVNSARRVTRDEVIAAYKTDLSVEEFDAMEWVEGA